MEERGKTNKSTSSFPGLAERLDNVKMMVDIAFEVTDVRTEIHLTFDSIRLGG